MYNLVFKAQKCFADVEGFVSVTSFLDEALSHVNSDTKGYKKKDGRDLSD